MSRLIYSGVIRCVEGAINEILICTQCEELNRGFQFDLMANFNLI